jgi:8-oxo-dGTP diphosphatase
VADYNKIGLLTLRDGRLLLCRKKHTTSLLILPGGCLEPGESALACLERELREELGDVSVTNLEYLGAYSDVAAGNAGKTVHIELYRGDLAGDPQPHSEILELVWFAASDDRSQLSPSLVNRILPDLVSRSILPWNPAPMPSQPATPHPPAGS